MRRDSRLSTTLHALLHLAEYKEPMTSEALANCMQTNSVVVRRTMAALRNAGLVRSEKGHGGGWTLTCDLRSVSLRDVYMALGEPLVFALGNRTENPECLVEQAVNRALNSAFLEAEELLSDRLSTVSLAELAADFHRLFVRHNRHQKKVAHGI
jgi:Rrf2 family protein